MTNFDLLSEFSIKIYMPPLSEMRESGRIRDLSNPIAVVMLVVDFETEVTMNGITSFIGNNTGIYADETVAALERIGCSDQSQQLKRIIEIAAAAGMTHDAIRQERSCISEYAITSFAELHGNKWNAAGQEIDKLNRSIDYSVIMQHAERFVGAHRSEFIDGLSS